MSLTTSITASINALLTVATGVGSAQDSIAKTYSDSLTNGTAAGQADTEYRYSSAGLTGSVTFDLQALTNALGQAIAFARVKAIILVNRSVADGQFLLLGGSGAGGLASPFGSNTDKLQVGPGSSTCPGLGIFYTNTATGYVVSAASHLLKLDAGANPVPCDLIIIGCSA